MAADRAIPQVPIRMVIVTLDAHLADAFERARAGLGRALPGLSLSLHIAADFGNDTAAQERARQAWAAARWTHPTPHPS